MREGRATPNGDTTCSSYLKKATKTARLRCGVMTSLLLYLIVANVLAIVIDYPRYAVQ